MKRKNIALIHYAYPPNIGGVEILIKEQAHILADLGHRVTVLTGSGKEPDPRINLHLIEEFRSILNFNPKLQEKIIDKGVIDDDFYKLAGELEKILSHHLQQIDTVIIHNMLTVYRNLPFIYGFHQYAKKNRQKKIIVWVHDHMYIGNEKIRLKEINKSQLEKQLLTSSIPGATYVVISETFKKLLIQVMDLSPDNVVVVPDGVNIKQFLEIDTSIWRVVEKYNLFQSFPIILCPVNILERKNIEYGLEIVSYLKKDYPKLLLIISGQPSKHRKTTDYLQKLENLIDQLNISSQIVFLGRQFNRGLKDSEIHDLYSLADLVFYFSKSENFGLPILEASLTKTPIFVSNLKVFHEVGDDFINFIDYKKISPQQAGATIKKFIEQNSLLKANFKARSKYSLETIVKKRLVPLL